MSDWLPFFRSQGYAIIRGVFNPLDIEVLRGAFDLVLHQARGLTSTLKEGITEYRVVPVEGKPTFKFAKWAAAQNSILDGYRLDPRLMKIVSELLGPDLRQIINQMHFKNPGDGVSFEFHQDCTFRKPDSAYRDLANSFVQVAIAVDEATEENGCLQFIPESHREGKPLLEGGYDAYEVGSARHAKVLARFPPPVSCLLQPGDIALWNAYTIHGSEANQSQSPRRTYINGYGTASKVDHGVWALKSGRPVPLAFDAKTQWDHVEER